MDRILKLVYPYTYFQHGMQKHYYNGIYPTLINHLNNQLALKGNDFDAEKEIEEIVNKTSDKRWHFNCHSNFYYYFQSKFNDPNLTVNVDGILDDGAIYLYPIEIRTTIDELGKLISLVFNGEQIHYTLIDTMPPKLVEMIRIGKVKIIVNIIHDPCVTTQNVIKFENMLSHYGINGENSIFIWGNDYQKLQRESSDCKIKFTYGILPLQQQARSMMNFPRETSLGYVSDIVREKDLNKNKIRSKRFLCFNRTMKPHRYMLAHLALKHNLLNTSYISFLNSDTDAETIYKNLTVFNNSSSNITREDAKRIYDIIPYHLDTQELEKSQMYGFTTDNNKQEFYLDSYIHLISETLFETGDGVNPFFSEKTFRPIQNLQPFIYVGEPFSLRLLHRLGFKTFDPVINESYDLETDPAKRMKMIESEIIRLNSMPIRQLHDLYYSLVDICIYNQNHFSTFAHTNPFDNVFNDINKFYSK